MNLKQKNRGVLERREAREKRNNKIIEMRKSGIGGKELASLFGLTHQMIHKITKEEVRPNFRDQNVLCTTCNKIKNIYLGFSKYEKRPICLDCGKSLWARDLVIKQCITCGTDKVPHKGHGECEKCFDKRVSKSPAKIRYRKEYNKKAWLDPVKRAKINERNKLYAKSEKARAYRAAKYAEMVSTPEKRAEYNREANERWRKKMLNPVYRDKYNAKTRERYISRKLKNTKESKKITKTIWNLHKLIKW